MNDAFSVPATRDTEPDRRPADMLLVDERRTARIEGAPALYKSAHERLAVDLAMNMADPEEVFRTHGYSAAQALELTESAAFSALLKKISSEVRESGLSFKTKAKALAEELLTDAFEIATDPLQSGTVRARVIEWVARVAGHEPAPAKGGVGEGAGGFSLSISFAGQAPTQVLAEGRTLEHQP